MTECEYWLGGIVLSRGHLSPAGPLALQLFRMCHRSVSQTGTTHTHMAMSGNDKSGLTLEVKGESASLYLLHATVYDKCPPISLRRRSCSKIKLQTKIARPVNTAEERLAGCDTTHKSGTDLHYRAYGGTPAAGKRRRSYDPCKTQPC